MNQKLVFLLVLGVLGVILTSVPLAMAQDEGGETTAAPVEGADAAPGDAATGGDAVTDAPAGDGADKPEPDSKDPKVSGPGEGEKPAPPAGELKCYQCLYAPNVNAVDADCKDFNKAPDASKSLACTGTPSTFGGLGITALKALGIDVSLVTVGKPACIISHVVHKDLKDGGEIFIRDCAMVSEDTLGKICLEEKGDNVTGGFSGKGDSGWGCACNGENCNGVRPEVPAGGGTPGTPGPSTPSTTTKPHNPTDEPEAGTAIQSSILCILGAAIFLVTFSTATGI